MLSFFIHSYNMVNFDKWGTAVIVISLTKTISLALVSCLLPQLVSVTLFYVFIVLK